MSYTYDYARVTGEESVSRQYWRFMKMTLTRLVRAKTFQFDGQTYEYLYHMYNKTWKNERTLWTANYQAVPNSPRAALNLGNTYQYSEPERAEQLFK